MLSSARWSAISSATIGSEGHNGNSTCSSIVEMVGQFSFVGSGHFTRQSSEVFRGSIAGERPANRDAQRQPVLMLV